MVKMNDRITFYLEENYINDNGFNEVRETEVYKCWANYKNMSGKEFISSYANNSKIVCSFRVRNCSKLKDIKSLTHKIKYKNNDYDIVYINDTNKDFWDFKCEVLK